LYFDSANWTTVLYFEPVGDAFSMKSVEARQKCHLLILFILANANRTLLFWFRSICRQFRFFEL